MSNQILSLTPVIEDLSKIPVTPRPDPNVLTYDSVTLKPREGGIKIFPPKAFNIMTEPERFADAARVLKHVACL